MLAGLISSSENGSRMDTGLGRSVLSMALLGSSGFPVDEERDGYTEGEEKN